MKKEQVEAFGSFDEALSDVSDYEFVYEDLLQNFSDQINNFMKLKNISRSELAERLNCSKAYITKVLSANANVSLKTVAKFTNALNAQFKFRLDGADREIRLFSVVYGKKKIRRPQKEKIEKFRPANFESEEYEYAAVES